MAGRLQQIGLIGRHPAEGVAGANLGNGAFVAVDAAVVPHLQEERAVAETVTALDAFGAANAQPLVNGVFVVGILDVSPLDGGGGALAVLRAGVQVVWLGLEVAGAKLSVAADGEGIHAFVGGLFEDAGRGAVAAAHALHRIDLPHGALGTAPSDHHAQ